ncbi:AbrB/MazE/SpoVT family DNA-binding domain-containing protein [Candidatus Sneabacter namystus]|uniref:SpoVT-AbrB domain-containing protein n=1 Tax=Candidatus Sneabacter namystus TaxID=2601646 RepID=A0A5C0UHV9_9RICK|nr:hypothetical protein [Candidatus Sneabacter namystus]QEK39347.1 hypothetical protein FZC37_00080 [Candidatus Sneabacter namystus]
MIKVVSIDRNGRVFIPASIRKDMELQSGGRALVEYSHGELKIKRPTVDIDKVHAIFTKRKKRKNVVSDLLEQRRREVEQEERECLRK